MWDTRETKNFLEGPVAPFHYPGMRKTLGKVKNLMPCSCEDPQIPQSIDSLQHLGV